MYVSDWVNLIIYTIQEVMARLFEWPFIDVKSVFISLGDVFLYFAIASILLSFIFQVRINSRWFKKE